MPRLNAIMPGASQRIAETAERILAAQMLYRRALDSRLRKLVERRGPDYYLPLRLWRKEPAIAAIAFEWLVQWNFTPGQIRGILRLMQAESGRSIASATHLLVRHRDFLVLTSKAAPEADLIQITAVPSMIETSAGKFSFSWQDATVALADDRNIAFLDARDIGLPLVLRTRREGDYFYPLGMGGKKKKLKRFLIDQKVALHEKARMLILECDKKVLWIAGYRIDERFKIKPDSTKILKVAFSPA